MKKFCVIGPIAFERTWVETEEEAIVHGTQLLKEQYGKSKSVVLFVVEIKKALEVGGPPVIVREPESKDFEMKSGPA